ncbi:MAG: hypothetical protein K6G30_12275 [Acetatifactor sp.]|nr:hypothetical protein [Acetatifactor sp.]
MTWDEYYEKINDWAVSTAVNKISSLEDMGTADEIVEALVIIGFEDVKGATRLLNRALQHGIKFSGENLAEIADYCTEESFKKALAQSADALTVQDLEDLYGCVSDELIIDLSKRYKIDAPEDIADEYEEELHPDGGTPIAWNRFYNAFRGWNLEYAIARASDISDFGEDDEVLDVVQELFGDDEPAASLFIKRALDGGVMFSDSNLLELSELCDEDTVNRAVFMSRSLLTEDSLEELYGNVSDDVIIVVAKEQKIRLPEDLREEEEEPEDLRFAIQSAFEAADYALSSLVQAQRAMNDSENISFMDMTTKGFFTSWWKQNSLAEADAYVQQAQHALNLLNAELKPLSKSKSVHLEYGRLATAIDLWFDDSFMDALTHMQIHKAQRRIGKAISKVDNIRRELWKLL